MEHLPSPRLLGAISFLCCSLVAPAQLVFVPDTNLRNALNLWVPGCVDGSGYLDTALPSAADSTLVLDVNWTPADLTGLGSIPVLKRLTVRSQCLLFPDTWIPCSSNSISVADWPADLRVLVLDHGTYPALPAWPAGAETLALEDLVTPDLPAWPTSLFTLTYSHCTGHSSFPPLPSGVNQLVLAGPTDLVQFPTVPPNVTDLNLAEPAGGQFPAIPGSVTRLVLNAGEQALTMPALPNSILDLYLSGFTQPEPFPSFPSGLVRLTLFYNHGATVLPPLPGTLEDLEVMECPDLQTLPALPQAIRNMGFAMVPLNGLNDLPDSLRTLTLASVSVQCLPLFPDSMRTLDLNVQEVWGPAPVPCYPNAPAGLLVREPGSWVFLPIDPADLCTVLNSTCTFVNPVATGTVYWDQNANGAREAGEPGYPFATINAQPGNITYGVPLSGAFELPLPLAQYTLTASSTNPYVQSIAPASHDAPFVNNTDVDAGNDFGVVLQPGVQDVRIDLDGPWGRPGFETPGHITYDNIGSTVVDGTIVLQLDADQTWVGAVPAPTSVSGNTITWDYAGLQVGEVRTIQLTVFTDLSVALGTELDHTATAGPVVSDATPADNTSMSIAFVEGSFDPNDKQVQPTTLTPAEVMAGTEVIYTIRFQNTGTYQADRVIITDQLSNDLQWNTLRLINSSHPCTWVLSGDGLLRFTFDPIVLPDSTTDEPNSHGHVRFALEAASDLMLGESVGNTANIYFDFNAPVITNEALFTVDDGNSITELPSTGLRLWPNPVRDVLVLSFTRATHDAPIEVIDAAGRPVLRTRFTGDRLVLPVAHFAPGLYTVRCGSEALRFVKD